MAGKKRLALAGAAVCLILGVILTLLGGTRQKTEDYARKLEAAQLMQSWMDAVKEYKAEVGLSVSEEDLHQTGLIGAPYTEITTTHGALEAKRTTANPDMAALMVQMLTEAGMKPGDTVGAGFSGSFPAMDLAVLAACQTMDLRCIYIASVGASTYGANQPELTFPDMAYRLYQDGLLDTPPALVTPGGVDDCGLDMDEGTRETILARLEGYGAQVMRQPDFEQNLQARMDLYQQQGPIDCFVGVGGNLTTTGAGNTEVPYGLIAPDRIRAVDRSSGLIQRYNAQGLPVIHLLNIQRLTADYSLPYDPERLTPPGESAVYYTAVYPRLPGAVCLVGAAACLFAGFIWPRWKERREEHEKP